MQEMLIVGDIAGEYDALIRLVARVPETTFVLAVGDLVDRGPQSKEVVQWFMENQHRADCLMGNHEHMMIDFLDDRGIYYSGVWHGNGGVATMQSYDPKNRLYVPSSHLNFLAGRAKYKIIPGEGDIPQLFVSHAALNPTLTLNKVCDEMTMDDIHFDDSIMWNRGAPKKREGVFQVMGHNSHWGVTKFEDWAICIDGSRSKCLTGFKWPSREIIQEPYERPVPASE
jgi:serine/threonine protein phosphatase 1